MEMQKNREEIDSRYKWRLEDLFETDELWLQTAQAAEEKIEEIRKYSGKFTKNAASMAECIGKLYELNGIVTKLYVYAYMRRDEDSTKPFYQDLAGKADMLATKFSAAVSFFEPELLTLNKEKISKYIKKEPALGEYAFTIEEIMRKKAHVLSKAEERLLAMSAEATSAGQDVFMMFNNADIKFPVITDENGKKVELTNGRYLKFMESPDRNTRKRAFKALYDTYGAYRNTLAAAYAGSVKSDKFYAEAQKYSSCLSAALYQDNVPSTVYNGLIQTVHANIKKLTPYLELRKKMLGVRKLHMYDLYVPFVKTPQKTYSFEEAREIVLEALKPLGEEYGSVLKTAFTDGWIDVQENRGKRTGAYSWGCYGCHPFVLLNWQGMINDVFTLAHELGHAMHTYYSNTAQPLQYAEYKIFVAEVASTVNENLLMEYLLAHTKDDTEKAFLLNHYLEEFRATVFRQTMFAEFEKTAHKMYERGESLTCEALSSVYYRLQKKYFKKVMKIDKEIALEWARIPHFYTAFYVYKYATGFSAATILASGILSADQEKLEKYLAFLKGGSSDYPMELLRKAGVDLSGPEPVQAALELFEQKTKQLEALTGSV